MTMPVLIIIVIVVVPMVVLAVLWVAKRTFESPWDAKDKVVVITGASSGIGEELAKQYAGKGAKLVLCARREEQLSRVGAECERLGARGVECVQADVSVEEDCKMLADRTGKRFGMIDLLLLNAGISMGDTLENVPDLCIYRNIMDVNYFGSVHCTFYALPWLKKSKQPKIAVVSSLLGKLSVPTRTGYCASKHALHGFFDCLRYELKPYGVRITMILPGVVQTDINRTRQGSSRSALVDTSKGMPIDTAGCMIVRAVARGQRHIYMTNQGAFAIYLRTFLPDIVDHLSYVKFIKGMTKSHKEE